MKRIVIAENVVQMTFTTEVGENLIGQEFENGANGYFEIAAGEEPLICNVYAQTYFNSFLAARAAGAEIMVFQQAKLNDVAHPVVLSADSYFPANVQAILVNQFNDQDYDAEAFFSFPVTAERVLVAVRCISICGMGSASIKYNLVQIK